ncbi:NYN domain-containing protein [candidate division KSB1 bacterium]|nr:NYN domain-containing protein [candidate division KSB1 bacterium]MBL7094733.1 NYN domain-containing protein [candidate division KSB1 bacterium]
MNPHYIIDGYNLIHKIPKFKNAMELSLEHSRNRLISFLKAYQSSKNINITLVFDGDNVGYTGATDLSTKRLKIIYSHSPEKADPLIKRLIVKVKNKKSLTLISADNDLINFCKSQGAHVLSPEMFFYQASKHPKQEQMDQKYNQAISPGELDEWMKIFEER